MPTKPETPEMTELQAHLAALRAEIGALAKAVAETAEARARETLKGLTIAGAEPLGEANQEVHKAMKTARSYVEQKPLQAFGIAAGAGFVLGLLIGRR
jgi:ElaB/YqjD/DUF883 family membrane-anchored ribosome-binding protein